MKLQRVTNEISEMDPTGKVTSLSLRSGKAAIVLSETSPHGQRSHTSNDDKATRSAPAGYRDATLDFLKRVFLPKDYPGSVPPDYTRYQIYNALQAFCNSLASLIASRALLEGQGIGNASASATDALLLNVFLDVFGRMTEITSAHLLGTSLVPDAKRYRLLADILNDSAQVLDTISPLFNVYGVPKLRIFALCLSACFRALCGIVAGGSKAAIAMHFATPLSGKGDIGDLNAKDMSKQTVLALFGMLLGSLVVPRLTTPFATYAALSFFISMHIILNYLGVRCLVLRTMNHDRLWASWFLYADEKEFSLELVNSLERIFPVSRKELFYLPIPVPGLPRSVTFVNPFKMETLTAFRNPLTQEVIGYVTLGSAYSKTVKEPLHPEMLMEFQQWNDFIIWFDERCLVYRPAGAEDVVNHRSPVLSRGKPPHVHVCFKKNSTPGARVRAWLAAGLLCKSISDVYTASPNIALNAYSIFLSASRSSSFYDENLTIDEKVWKLCKEPKNSFDRGGLWNQWKARAKQLGWDLGAGEKRTDLKGKTPNVTEKQPDYGAELGVTIPEPKSVIVGLGYSYESRKDE